MRPFRSKLDAVLKLRQKEEESRLETYGRAARARQAAADAVAALRSAVDSLRLEVKTAMNGGCSAAVLGQFHGYGLRLGKDLSEAENRLQIAENGLQTALRELQTARRKRETVEKFQAKERVEYDKEAAREEQKILDEMALRRPTAANPWSMAGI